MNAREFYVKNRLVINIIIIVVIPTVVIGLVLLVRKMTKPNYTKSYLELPFISLVTENQQAFGEKVISISNELGIDPRWLMIVMKNESGVNSHIKNTNSSATGLIQFMAGTAAELGTTTESLASMSNVDQLDYVKKYLNNYKGKIKSLSDTYLAVFFPVALTKGEDYAFPAWAVNANPIFFKSGSTKKDFNSYVDNKYNSYLA